MRNCGEKRQGGSLISQELLASLRALGSTSVFSGLHAGCCCIASMLGLHRDGCCSALFFKMQGKKGAGHSTEFCVKVRMLVSWMLLPEVQM